MEKQFISTGHGWEKEFPFTPDKKLPWTPVVKVKGRSFLFIAGQTAWDDAGRVIVPHNMGVQTEQVYKNVEDALKAGGAKLNDIVFERVHVINMEAFISVGNPTRSKFFADAGVINQPPHTLIEVKRLAVKGFMIEVEVVAAAES